MFFLFGGDLVGFKWTGEDTLFIFMFLGLNKLFLLFFERFELEAIEEDRSWLWGVPKTPWVFFVFLLKQKKSYSVSSTYCFDFDFFSSLCLEFIISFDFLLLTLGIFLWWSWALSLVSWNLCSKCFFEFLLKLLSFFSCLLIEKDVLLSLDLFLGVLIYLA